MMNLRPLDSPDLIRLVAGWLAEPDNAKWLDFGPGRRISPEWLTISVQRGGHVVRVFDADGDGAPIGAVGLNEVNTAFRTAHLWVVLGNKARAGRGYATRAVSKMLTLGFSELGLRAISTWIVDGNPSVRVAENVAFRPMGRQRQCHELDGRIVDRLWFDKLASEHKEA